MREGVARELVDRLRGLVSETLQNHQLCAADAGLLLKRAAGHANALIDRKHCFKNLRQILARRT